jgi:hypothetical protein
MKTISVIIIIIIFFTKESISQFGFQSTTLSKSGELLGLKEDAFNFFIVDSIFNSYYFFRNNTSLETFERYRIIPNSVELNYIKSNKIKLIIISDPYWTIKRNYDINGCLINYSSKHINEPFKNEIIFKYDLANRVISTQNISNGISEICTYANETLSSYTQLNKDNSIREKYNYTYDLDSKLLECKGIYDLTKIQYDSQGNIADISNKYYDTKFIYNNRENVIDELYFYKDTLNSKASISYKNDTIVVKSGYPMLTGKIFYILDNSQRLIKIIPTSFTNGKPDSPKYITINYDDLNRIKDISIIQNNEIRKRETFQYEGNLLISVNTFALNTQNKIAIWTYEFYP